MGPSTPSRRSPGRDPPVPRNRFPTVLFVCEHNADRSQLAAGLAAAYAGDRVNVLSAGTAPDAAVSPVSRPWPSWHRPLDQMPTQLTDELLRRADVLVTLKAGLAFAAPTGIDQQTWDLPNPADWDVNSIRPLRDCTPSCTTSASSVGAGEGRCARSSR